MASAVRAVAETGHARSYTLTALNRMQGMAARFRAFVLAGTGSGCGKTTVTLGLLSLPQQRGMRVQPCKVGS